MRASFKPRVVGFVVVLILLAGVALLVLHKRGPIAAAEVDKSVPRQMATLPPIALKPAITWHAKRSQPVVELSDQPEKPLPVERIQQEPVRIKPVVSHRKPVLEAQLVIQVASYRSRQNAESMQLWLKGQGYVSSVHKVNTKTGRWYRLIAGPFTSDKQTKLVQQSILQKWKLHTRIRVVH